MTTSAFKHNIHVSGTCHHRTWLAGNNPCRQRCEDVQAIAGYWHGTRNVQHSFFDHDIGSAVALLTRLEPDQDITIESVFDLVQQLCGTNC